MDEEGELWSDDSGVWVTGHVCPDGHLHLFFTWLEPEVAMTTGETSGFMGKHYDVTDPRGGKWTPVWLWRVTGADDKEAHVWAETHMRARTYAAQYGFRQTKAELVTVHDEDAPTRREA
jgi:hypothetical protein